MLLDDGCSVPSYSFQELECRRHRQSLDLDLTFRLILAILRVPPLGPIHRAGKNSDTDAEFSTAEQT